MKSVFIGIIGAVAIGASLWWFITTHTVLPVQAPKQAELVGVGKVQAAQSEGEAMATLTIKALPFEEVEIDGISYKTKAELAVKQKEVAQTITSDLEDGKIDFSLLEEVQKVTSVFNCQVVMDSSTAREYLTSSTRNLQITAEILNKGC